MQCSIPINYAIDLHDLMLSAEENVPAFQLNAANCFVSYKRGSAIMGAVGDDFAIAVVAIGWCVGEHSQAWQFHLIGDAVEAFRWLRRHTSKRLMRYLARALPLGPEDRILCLLLA